MSNMIDIISNGEYPANVLSNFYPHEFEIDGVHCASMEGFLQSLKTKNKEKQKYVCLLSGKEAKNVFRHRFDNLRWKITGVLYWNGQKFRRTEPQYQALLNRAYSELAKNKTFSEALLTTGDAILCHSIGKSNPRFTVLTEKEFIDRLIYLRNHFHKTEDVLHGRIR